MSDVLTPSRDIAHRLRALGLSVIPVPRPRPGAVPGTPGDGKTPVVKWGTYQSRLPTVAELDAWFDDAIPSSLNLAVITGAVSGVVVIDVDVEDLRWTDQLPDTPWLTDTAHGWHLWYQHPGFPVPNKVRLKTDDGRLPVDVRGDGGYVIAPGSIHASGVVYQAVGDWTIPRDQLPRFDPAWLPPSPAPAPEEITPHERPFTAADVGTRARAYLAKIPRPEIGAGSDAATFIAACHLVRGFNLTPSDAEQLLWEWAGGRSGWTREWIQKKVTNALVHGDEAFGALL